MAKNQADLIDLGALVAIPFFAGFVLEVFTFQLNLFGGYDFGAPLWTVGGANISAALIGVVVSLVWIIATNMIDESDYDQYVYGSMVFAFLLPLLYVFIPAVQTLIASSDVLIGFSWLGVAVAATFVSYKG